MNSIRGYLIKADKICAEANNLTVLEVATAPDTKMLWLDIQGDLTPETEEALSRILLWHPIVLENFHLASSRPKLINFDRYSQVTLHALNLGASKDETRTIEIDAVLAKTYLVTYHKNPVQSIEDTLEDLAKGRLNVGPDELLYHIISHLVEKYVPAIENKKDLITALEEEALYAPSPNLLERIVLIRDEIIDLGMALTPQQMILTQMASGASRQIRPFIRPYYRDAENRMRNLIEEQNSYKEILANTLELYRSAMSSRTNDTMKVLTAMSAMFLPLTFLTGLFGMNVRLPLMTHQHAFLWIISICLVTFVAMMTYFKLKSWF
jgi:magnesium transporter